MVGEARGAPLAAAAAAANKSERTPAVGDAVGRPATHASGPLHCTGEAAYVDNIPVPSNLLHGALVLASRCHARLASVDVAPERTDRIHLSKQIARRDGRADRAICVN